MDGDMMMGEEESESEEEEVVSKSIVSFLYGWTHGTYIRELRNRCARLE